MPCMSSTFLRDPHTVWAMRKRSQTAVNTAACRNAAGAVRTESVISFEGVTLIEYGTAVDIGILRLEPEQLVFAGSTTRVIPYASIVLLNVLPVFGCPGRNACSVNSTEYHEACVFRSELPVEYHIGAWYSRWLEGSRLGVDTPASVGLPPAHR